MKRTNLTIDEKLLAEVMALLKAPTYSAAVNQAMEETIKLYRIRKIGRLIGSGIWDGDLESMRGDRGSSGRPRRRRTAP